MHTHISSCPCLRDLDNTFTHMRTHEVMHTSSCVCFTTYPDFFSTSTYIRQYTYPCTCVLRVCVHLRLHTSHACKRVRVCMSRQDAIYTQLRIHLCSLAHVYIYMRTHALTTLTQHQGHGTRHFDVQCTSQGVLMCQHHKVHTLRHKAQLCRLAP